MENAAPMTVMEQSRAIEANPEFKGLPLLRLGSWLWNTMVPVMVWATWPQDDRRYLWYLLAAGYVWAFLCWPRTIRFENDHLEQRNVFGKMKLIRYEDVMAITWETEHGKYSTTKVIVSGLDCEIVHTAFHADRWAFVGTIQERTGKKMHSWN